MIAIIVISEDPGFSETLHQEASNDAWKISHHTNLLGAKPLLTSGIFDFCIIDAGSSLRRAAENLEAFGLQTDGCKFVAVADASAADIQYAYQYGFFCVLPAPLQVRLLKLLLSPVQTASPTVPTPSLPTPPGKNSPPPRLDVIKSFAPIFSHSLDLPSLVRHFILKVREIVGVNRIAIFLEEPKTTSPSTPRRARNRLRHVSSIGIPPDIQDVLEFSKNHGIGSWTTKTGQILRAEQAGMLLTDPELSRVHQEFNILGCQIAIPITDRERTIGVAMLGGHLTRIGFSDEELQLMFHLMEELGISVKNNWLHSELAANYRLFGEVLASMKSGSLVVSADLEIIHANPAMIKFIKGKKSPNRLLTFADLPVPLAGRIHDVVENGNPCEPFSFKEEGEHGKNFRVSIIPFQNQSNQLPQSVMVMMEDFTEVEHAREIATQATNQKLANLVAKRFAHEIRSSLSPLTTHLQLLDDRYQEPDFQASLKKALRAETTRISRFTDQMLFLAQPTPVPSILTGVEKLLRESFAKAQEVLQIEGILTVHNKSNRSMIRCHPPGLSQAFLEIFINGLQTDPAPQIRVTVDPVSNGQGNAIRVGFRDNGNGFTEEVARRAMEPFYTSRESGVGLGLTVANRVAQEHGGWIEIQPRSSETDPDLLMYFPTNDNHD